MKLKSKYGMVVSGHKKATESGIRMLKNGGNAIDAAIAAASTLAVAIPNMNGLGGDSIALYYNSKKKKFIQSMDLVDHLKKQVLDTLKI